MNVEELRTKAFDKVVAEYHLSKQDNSDTAWAILQANKQRISMMTLAQLETFLQPAKLVVTEEEAKLEDSITEQVIIEDRPSFFGRMKGR